MVNKAAVGILGVIVVVSLGVGVIVGMQLGVTDGTDAAPDDGPSGQTQGDQTGDGQAQGGSQDGDGETNGSPDAGTESDQAATADAASPTEQRTTVPARRFDADEIAAYVATFVNREREANGLGALQTDGSTSLKVAAMATNHSVAMADAGEVSREINGVSTHHRYRSHDLADRCKYKAVDAQYVRDPGQERFADEFEVVGSTVAGQPYESGGETRFNDDERSVARAVVDTWTTDADDREPLMLEGPSRLGVGVDVTESGDVYATASLCA